MMEANVALGDATIGEDVTNEQLEALGGALDAAERFFGWFREQMRAILEEGFGVSLHGAKGRAEIVGDAVGKSIEFGIGLAEFGRAFGNRLFQEIGGLFAGGDIASKAAGVKESISFTIHAGI